MSRLWFALTFAIVCTLAGLSPAPVSAQGARPLAILLPGAGGAIPSDVLIRNLERFRAAGFDVTVATSAGEAAAHLSNERSTRRRIVFVSMSRGGNFAARALASGARPDGVVFVSTNLPEIADILGSPTALPSTLIVHHRRDACPLTPPEAVPGFVNWSGRKARTAWVNNSGAPVPNPCGPFGAHGFFREDGAAMAAILAFVRR